MVLENTGRNGVTVQSRAGVSGALAVAGVLASIVLGIGSLAAGDDRQPSGNEGRFLFTIYCVNCHGESGKGDGPAAEFLKTRPADLTRIRDRNGGEFPSSKVYDTISGLSLAPGHRSREMPLWGFAFRELDRDTNQSEQVRHRILQLVMYLESIQDE